MGDGRRFGRLNVRALVVLVAIVVLVTGGVVVGHLARHRALAQRALAAGTTAMRTKNWPEAYRQFRAYLSRYPDDDAVRTQYAEATLAIRPQKPEHVEAAIGAYRRLLQRRMGDGDLCLKLAKLYYRIGDYKECAYIARQRLTTEAEDGAAMLWLGRALVGQGKEEEAAQVLEALVREHSNEVQGYALLAGIAMQATTDSAAATARAWLDQAVERNPRSSEALAQRARFHRLIDKNEAAARADLEAADASGPQDPSVLIVLATEWMEWRELDRAAHALALMERTDPATLKQYDVEPDLLAVGKFTVAGKLALLAGNAERGAELADRALQQLPEHDHTPFLPVAVDLYVEAGRVRDARAAVEELRKAVKLSAKADSPLAEQLALLDASVAAAEGRNYAAINGLEPFVEDKPQNARAWKLLAQAYEKTNQDRRALAAYEEYLSRAPHDAEVTLKVAEAYLDHDMAAAVKYATRAERLAPNDVEAKVVRIAAELNSGDLKAADPEKVLELSGELARLREAHPRMARIRILQAREAARAGRSENAVRELESATEQCDDKLAAELELVRLHWRLRQFERAIEVCRRAIDLQGNTPGPRIMLADLYAAADRPGAARQTLEQAAAGMTGQDKLAVQIALAQLLLHQAQRDEAIALLRQLAAEFPDNVQILGALLRLPEVQKDTGEAQQIVDRIRDLEGDRGLLWRIEQAKLHLREPGWTQRQREIEDHLTQCIHADRAWSEPVLVLGRMYEAQRRDDEAERVYRLALSSARQQGEVITQLLALLERRERFADAAVVLEQLPQDEPALSAHRIRVAIGLGDAAAARGYLKRQIAAHPEDAASRVILARLVYAQEKDVLQALRLLDEAVAASPDALDAVATRASILWAEGRNGEAAALMNDTVARRDDFAVYLARARFHEATGKADLAEKDYLRLGTFAQSAAEGYTALAGFYLRQGRPNEAITACDAGLRGTPDDPDLQRMLMKALVADGQAESVDRALRTIDKLLGSLPDDLELLTIRAGALLVRNTPESTREAQTVLERVVELDPRQINAHLQLIDLARRRGDGREEDRLAIRALGANPDSMDLVLARARVEAGLGNASAARELADAAARIEPKNVKAHNLRAELALHAGDVASARKFNEEARSIAPGGESAQLMHAEILERDGYRDEAVKALKAYCESEEGKGSVRAALALAEFYRTRKDFERASELLDRAAGLSPGGGAVFLARLRWLATQGQYDEVRTRLTERRTARPGEAWVLLPAAQILASSGVTEHLREARSVLAELSANEPAHVPSQLALAQVTYQLGDTDASQQAYRRVLDLEPDHRQALNDLAWILAHSEGDDGLREAKVLADRGLRLHAADMHLLDTRGVVLLKMGQFEEARNDLEKCVGLAEAQPATRAKALLHLAQVLNKTGGEVAARSALEKARLVDQTHHVLSDEELAEVATLLRSP